MRVLLTMANNSTTPYFSRFADLERANPTIDLQFLCLYPEKPEMLDEMRAKGFQCHWIKYDSSKRKTQLVIAFFRCLKVLTQLKPDVVHSHLFEDSLPVLLASWLLRIKKRVISKLDAGYHYHHTPKWVFLDKLNNKLATNIIAVSEENRDFILEKEKAREDKLALIYQGLPEEELRSENDALREDLIDKYEVRGRKVILNVSRYIQWKGQEKIIEAAKLLSKSHSDLRFLFFGAGEDKSRLENMVSENNLEQMVHIGDWISRDELNHLYEICDVYCNASTNEPFGFVIAEALLKKIPLVTTQTGAASALLKHKYHAYLIDNTPESITEGITYVLSNGGDMLETNGYELAQEYFTVERMWDRHKQLYLEP